MPKKPVTPTVVKTWALTTADKKPYTLAVLSDASLWISFGNSNAQLDPGGLSAAINDALNVIDQVNTANNVCRVSKGAMINGSAYAFTCDLVNGHDSRFHHDPNVDLYWLADA